MTDPEETHLWPIQSNRENSSLLHTNQYQTDILFLLSHLSQEKQ